MNDTEKIKESLKTLISLPGVSGHEETISGTVMEMWKPFCDEVSLSKIGHVYGLQKGCAPEGKPRHRIAVATHMDGIGMIVHSIKREFLSFAPLGGFDPRILPGQFVTIHTAAEDIPGLIVMPTHTKKDLTGKPLPMDQLLIDTGMDADEVKAKIRVGDTISFANLPMELPGDCIAGHSLDNRASIAALTAALMQLQKVRHEWDVYAVGTVQEETVFLSTTVPYDLRPDIAIAVDVTFAKGPGSTDWKTKPLESGASLGLGMNIHPELHRICKELCEEFNIPFTVDLSPSMSGTDGDPMQVSCGGFPVMVISIPLRYMHTPVEVISMKDVMNVARLLTAFISRLDDDFMQKLSWEDEE